MTVKPYRFRAMEPVLMNTDKMYLIDEHDKNGNPVELRIPNGQPATFVQQAGIHFSEVLVFISGGYEHYHVPTDHLIPNPPADKQSKKEEYYDKAKVYVDKYLIGKTLAQAELNLKPRGWTIICVSVDGSQIMPPMTVAKSRVWVGIRGGLIDRFMGVG